MNTPWHAKAKSCIIKCNVFQIDPQACAVDVVMMAKDLAEESAAFDPQLTLLARLDNFFSTVSCSQQTYAELFEAFWAQNSYSDMERKDVELASRGQSTNDNCTCSAAA